METQKSMYKNVVNTDFGVLKKSQNIMGVSKKCVVMLTNLAGERFDSVF